MRLDIQGKKIEDAKIVCMGAGAAAIACMELTDTSVARYAKKFTC